MESLTDIIITYERHQHEKTRRLQQLHQVSGFRTSWSQSLRPISYGQYESKTKPLGQTQGPLLIDLFNIMTFVARETIYLRYKPNRDKFRIIFGLSGGLVNVIYVVCMRLMTGHKLKKNSPPDD